MTTFPRTGFTRSGRAVELIGRHRRKCSTGKVRHATEAVALEALARVRRDRIATGDPDPPESRIYICARCNGWHLTSTDLSYRDLEPIRERSDGEAWEAYAKRLERRIAEQRAQILSLLALGHGAAHNRASRKRVEALTVALGHMTERWENERRNREEVVRQIDALRARRSFTYRVFRRLRRSQ